MSTQRVPAWKRLGLKLKGPASGDSPTLPATTGNANANQNQSSRPNAAHINGNGTPATKRNLTPSTPYSHTYEPANKRLRTGDRSFASDRDTSSSLRRQKSVSFVDGTKDSPARPSATTATPNSKKKPSKKPKKKKKAAKAAAAPTPDFDLTPTLSYLRLWATDRTAWKFNKNHQTLLIKYVFDGTPKIPSTDIGTFLDYIRDLKGGVRSRLREAAAGIRKTDMEQGQAGFPADVKDKEEKQKQYEEVIGRFLEDRKAYQQGRRAVPNEDGDPSGGKSRNKRSFDEVELVLRTIDPETKQRLLKRIRAEMVLEELSESEEGTTSTEAATATSSTQEGSAADNEMDVDSKIATAAQPTAKRRRIRNARTAAVDTSESESGSDSEESESEADSSSSSSSSEDDSEDEEMEDVPGQESSSSSSSSSSEPEDASEPSSDEDGDE